MPGGKGNSGPFRFRPEYGIDGTSPLRKGANGGYMDRFGNEWVKVPYHGDKSLGFNYEWDVYLSKNGENHWNLFNSASKRQGGGKYLNVRPDGQLSH